MGLTAWAQRPDQPNPRTPPRANQPDANQPAETPQRRQPGTTARPVTPGVDPGTTTGSTVFVRATQVVGMEIRESTGQERIGVVADLLLTPDAGLPAVDPTPLGNNNTAPGLNAAPGRWQNFRDCDLRLALIQIDNVGGDRVVVVPWDLLQFQGTHFILGFPQERINEAPSVLLNDPRILQSDEWMQQVGTFFADDLQRIQQQRSTGRQNQPGRTVPGAQPRQPQQPGTAPGTTPRTPERTPPGTDSSRQNRSPNPGSAGPGARP
jgi:hypothetical protein